MASLCRKLKEEECGRLLGPCFITFAIPLLVPGFTLTLVAFSDDRGFSKFGVLHILGMVILAFSFLLIVLGCFLRCKVKSGRVSPESNGSEESSLADSMHSHLELPYSTHSTVLTQEGESRTTPTSSNLDRRRVTRHVAHSSSEPAGSSSLPPATSGMLPRDRQKRPARNRLDHDIEAVLGTSQERQDKRKHSGSAVPNNMDLNYMSEGEDDHAMKELQRMAESAAILGETHDLDDTSSYSTSSGSSASYSSSYSSQSEDETEVYVSRAAKGRNEPKPKGVHRENVHWASARAPVSSLAVLTAGEFGQVNRGLRELTHMEDSGTEVTDRNEQFAQNDRDEKFSQNAHSGLEDKSSQRQDCIVERTENEHREIESDSFIQSSHSSPFARPSDTRPQGPPAYEIADTYSRTQGDSTSSTGGQHSSDYSPSHGSYVLNSIPSERQSPASQVLFGLEGDVFDEKPFLTAKTDTPEDPAEDEVRRSVSPVPLKRSMGVSALEGSDVGEHVTVFSRSSRASTLRSDQSEESPERKARTLLQERVTSHTEDNGHDTGTQSEKGDAEHEKKKKKKKKKKKRRKKRKDDQRDGSEKQPAEPEVSSSQEVEGQETIPLRSIMHPYPNPTNISHHVHWPDDEEL